MESVPAVSEESMPIGSEECVPAVGKECVPVVECVPAVSTEYVPAVTEETVPAIIEAKVPEVNEIAMPEVTEITVPEGNEAIAPDVTETMAPVVAEATVPAVSEKFVKYQKAVKEDPTDFTSWTYLLQAVDTENILEEGREVYDEFFQFYPYCYGYWKKYADFEKKNGNLELAKKVLRAGVGAIPLSVDLWTHFINSMIEEAQDTDFIRSLFEEAVDAAGLEFRSEKLYDAYIEWEAALGNLKNVTLIYARLLDVPTQQYNRHFTSFKEHVNGNKPCDILASEEYAKMLAEVESIPSGVTSSDDAAAAVVPSPTPPGLDDAMTGDTIAPPGDKDVSKDEEETGVNKDEKETEVNKDEEETGVNKDEEETAMDQDQNEEVPKEKQPHEVDAEIRLKIIASREIVFKNNEEEVRKRWNFEDGIKRPYFHVKPLERSQLNNWREYLEFEIKEGNHKRICILFERCLIACALYEEFWQKYISYLESVNGEDRTEGEGSCEDAVDAKELSISDEDRINAIRQVYQRACTIHLRKKPDIALNWAAFEEGILTDVEKSREILRSLDASVPGVVMIKLRRAGLERRNGNPAEAVKILKEEIEKTLSINEKSYYALKCSRILYKYLEDHQAAKEVIFSALDNDKGNKQLYLNLLDMEMHCQKINELEIDRLCELVDNCQELSADFKQGFHQRRIEIFEDNADHISYVVNAYDAYQKEYNIKPGVVVSRKRYRGDSDADSRMKSSRTNNSYSMHNNTPDMVPQYPNSTYSSGVTAGSATPTNAYGYNQAMPNAWGAYSQQNAGNYYGWYNPYGGYPQQPTL